MKIGINLLTLNPGKIGGMEQYITNLIWNTSVNHHEDIEQFLFLTESNAETYSSQDKFKNITRVVIPDGEDIQRVAYAKIKEYELNLWFCPLLILEPLYLNIPTVVTIPDIQHEYFPEFFTEDVIKWRNKHFKQSAEKANAVLTLSEYSKQTIAAKYSVDFEKIHGIYLDATKEFDDIESDEEQVNEVKAKYGLPDRFGFYPANTWPHKNHISLLKALKILRENGRVEKLVFTGSHDLAHEEVKRYIDENNLSDQVCFLGYISQEDMPYIYLNAKYLIFPSLFEGFGIPLVEAMKTNLPILCSNAGSIPEVVEESAIFFDPLKPEDIADKILRLDNEQIRQELIEKGRKQAKKFSWNKSSELTLQIFKELVDKSINGKFKSDLPLVSIVTPSYNQGKFIKETIDSVLNQNYPNLEYIVMDGGSTDETVEILKQYGNKIKWVSEKDEGQADAVNKGIQMATGDIIGWLNSDDTYLPGAIQTAVEFLTTHKEISMMYGEGYHVEENGEIMERYPTEPFDYQRLAQTCFICQPTAFFRKDIFNQVGLLRKELHLCMDYELWMRIGKNHTIAYIPHFMATSRMYQDNKTLSRRKEVFIEIIKTVKLYYGYAPVSWVYGYADYLRSGSRNSLFYFTLIYLLVQYNYSHPRFLRNEIKTILKEKLKPIMKRKQFTDQYSDGWVDKVYKRSVTVRNQQRIVIKGNHLWPFSDPLKLVISLNNKKMMEFYQKEHGEFVVVVPVPTSFTGVAELKITANKIFNPKKLNINEDNRDLAFILHEIEIS